MYVEHDKQLDHHLSNISKSYLDPASSKFKIVDEKYATELAELYNKDLNSIYIHALNEGIWPQRYVRNQKTISIQEQILLLKSNVAVVGAGGLGGHLILILSRIGVGNIIVVDYDVFDETNLNRQAISSVSSIGRSKSEEAARMVNAINPSIKIQCYNQNVCISNAMNLFNQCNVIVDALDNIMDRLVLEKIAKRIGVPYIHGAIGGFSGQLMTIFPEDPGLAEIYGKRPQIKNDPNFFVENVGMPAVTASFIATLQAVEVIKVLLNRGRIMRNCLLHVDLETMQYDEFDMK